MQEQANSGLRYNHLFGIRFRLRCTHHPHAWIEGRGTRTAAEPCRVSPIMVTHGGNYGRNYAHPKALRGKLIYQRTLMEGD
jgi:hypothetical protein